MAGDSLLSEQIYDALLDEDAFARLPTLVAESGFDDEELAAPEENIVHLRRMLAVRGIIATGRRAVEHRQAMLDAVGYPLLSVTPEGRLIYANAAGEALLRRNDGLHLVDGRLCAALPSADRQLRAAIAMGGDGGAPSGVSVPGRTGGRHDLSLVPAHSPDGQRSVLITVSRSDTADASLVQRLRDLHGLTEAEARVAVALAEGASPAEIAEERGVAVGTIRVQIKAIASKLGVRRQAEIVGAVRRLPPMTGASGRKT